MTQALSELLLCSHVESRSHWLATAALELWVSRTVRPWIELCQKDLRVDLISTLGQVISWSFRTFRYNQNDLIDVSDFKNLVSNWVYEAYNMNEQFLQKEFMESSSGGKKRLVLQIHNRQSNQMCCFSMDGWGLCLLPWLNNASSLVLKSVTVS